MDARQEDGYRGTSASSIFAEGLLTEGRLTGTNTQVRRGLMKRVFIVAAIATAVFGFPAATAAAQDPPQDSTPTEGAPCHTDGGMDGTWIYVDGENAAHYGWPPGWVCRG